MKILVTGGAGFIGSNLVDKLIDKNYEVVVIDNLSTGKLENVNKKAKFYNMDIYNKNIFEVFEKEKFDTVYHLAAQVDVQKSINDPIYDANINTNGTINILEACKISNVRKIVYASSAAVYGNPKYLAVDEKHETNPVSNYGISKHTPEYYLNVYNKLWNIDYTILRYANVYGIRQDPKGEGGVVSIFMDKMLKHESPIIFGDGSSTRDYVYVEDIVNANIYALDRGSKEIFNIGTGKQTSVKKLFETMRSITDVDISEIYAKERSGDIKHSYYNIDKAKHDLGWKPKYTLEDGLIKTIGYYKH